MKNLYRIIVFCVSISIILSIGNLLVTIITKQLIDTPSFEFVIKLGAIWLLSALFLLTKNYVVQRSYSKKQKIYMASLLKTIFSFPFSILETTQYNDDLNKVKGYITQEQAFISSIESISNAVFGIIGFYILLSNQISLRILIGLSILLLVVILVSCFISGRLSALMYDYWQNYIKNTRKYNYIAEVLSNKEFVEEKKVYAYLPYFSQKFDKEFDFASKKNRQLGGKRIRLELITDVIFLIYSFLTFLILFFAYRENQITIGLFISATGYMLSLIGNISGAIATFENISKYKKIKMDIISFSQQKENHTTDVYTDLLDNSVLSIKDVQFKYPTSEKMIIDDVSFSFQKGKKYAIVGINGSGKTTLAKILSGLYAPMSGNVTYASRPVVLFQDFNRYPTTLKENIMLSEKFQSEENRILKIEEKSGLKNRISTMKLGDNTELTTLKEGGEELSGGEWQRVALARILWSDADIYILDEPTASLDPIEEIRIFNTYHELLKNKTVIFITHRLGFVKNVDEVIVLNNGKIAETGTHGQLMEKNNGLYKNMFEEQKSWYE